MELDGSLPRSQEPATCRYSKPDQSSPCSRIIFEASFSFYPPTYAYTFQVTSSPHFSYQYPA